MAVRQKSRKKIAEGVAHIKATFNNTMVAITTTAGDLLCQNSAGQSGFKGSRKGTPYAAQLAAEAAAKKVVSDFGMGSVTVEVQGPGAGRESAIRALKASGLEVRKLIDVTKLPHNGCRPPKKRRV